MSESAFQGAIKFILPHEEEFTRGHWGDDSKEEYVATENVPGDSGSTTRYGIDQTSHPSVDVANLTRDQAVQIYRNEWDAHNLDALPDKLAIIAFDVWVNGGHASLWLQHAYNVTHPGGDQLVEDGQLGTHSLMDFNECSTDEINAIVKVFLEERNIRFEALARSAARAKFLAGWEQRDADLAKLLS